jgi:hypothetical protein
MQLEDLCWECAACTACDTGYTTAGGMQTGATAQSQCDTCNVGYGGTSVSGGISGCAICAAGFFKAIASNAVCTACTTGYTTSGGMSYTPSFNVILYYNNDSRIESLDSYIFFDASSTAECKTPLGGLSVHSSIREV